MRILVTGAGGMLGHDVVRAAEQAGHEVLTRRRPELDVTDAPAVLAALQAEPVEAVVNCAAWTDVDGAEEHEPAATLVNGEGAGNVAAAAASVGARLVHVSTDYVFDGAATEPYVESSQVGPLSAYGRSKLAGERAVAERLEDQVTVRASWLFGVDGPNFVATMLRLAGERDEVTVVDDQVGCPTYCGHLATMLIDLAGRDERGVVHAGGPEACSWWEFAGEVFARAGTGTTVNRGRTADLGRPAPRPAFSVLRSERTGAPVLPPWREGLAAYLSRSTVHS